MKKETKSSGGVSSKIWWQSDGMTVTLLLNITETDFHFPAGCLAFPETMQLRFLSSPRRLRDRRAAPRLCFKSLKTGENLRRAHNEVFSPRQPVVGHSDVFIWRVLTQSMCWFCAVGETENIPCFQNSSKLWKFTQIGIITGRVE